MEREKTKRQLKFTLIAIAILIIAGYSLYQSQKLIQGPEIIITSPPNGSTISQSLIEVSGDTKNLNLLRLNDRDILKDEAGHFSEKILLSYGYNSLRLEGWDKFGRKTEKIIEMIYK